MKSSKKKAVKKINAPPGWEDPPDSFERFKKLTQGLLGVSKVELDKEIAKEERQKRKRRKAA